MFGLGKDKSVQEGLYAIAISILVASIIISFSVIYAGNIIAGNDLNTLNIETNDSVQADNNVPSQAEEPGTVVQVTEDDDAAKGDSNAPVTIIEFSEFQCPFCGRFARDTLPSIITDYVDTGKVKFIYRDFVVHTSSHLAQEAAECAGDQKKFWEYHDILFDNQENLADSDLKKYAAELGLNTATFNTCLDSRKYRAEVDKDTTDGRTAGVRGTPTFYINGKQFVGAQPYEKFKAEIEAALAA